MRISDWSSDVCSSDLPAGEVVALAADLDVRDVAQTHAGAVGVRAQHDGAKLRRRGELPLHQDAGADLLRGRARLRADAPRRHLGVLRIDGKDDALGRASWRG